MSVLKNNIGVDGDRLWQSLMAMAEIGPGVAGGNNRQALTDDDSTARHLFKNWCQNEGLHMSLDDMGNMFARRHGTDADALPIMIGSHLDTQGTGGKYDGVLGVMAGLEIIRSLNESGIQTRHPIEIVNWSNEEGCRFSPPMIASGVFAGAYDLEWAYARTDADGLSFGSELKRIGWAGDEITGQHPLRAYFELHIEQGPILEGAGIPIGVVTHGQGLLWTKITLIGKESHSGSTPMDHRANAGLGMARIITLVDNIAHSYAPNARGTVGSCEIFPNAVNVIPGKAIFSVDLRNPDPEKLIAMKNDLRRKARAIADEIGLEISFDELSNVPPIVFDSECVEHLRDAAMALNYEHLDIVSGAGHDAFWISKVAPSAMLMCPCVAGLSHNEAEEILPEWAKASTDVLYHAVLTMAGVVNGATASIGDIA
jgi:N-carbamoyl-L-amino-acid hydrolase